MGLTPFGGPGSGGVCHLELVPYSTGVDHTAGRVPSTPVVEPFDPIADSELGGCPDGAIRSGRELDLDCGPMSSARCFANENGLDARIGRLRDRPVNTGSIGEWIAARIFDIELQTAANTAGYDGRFTTGGAGRAVNIKAYTKHEGMLDINSNAPLDYYLVLTGAPSALASSRGTLRPFCIQTVLLFDAHRRHVELQYRGVKIGIATSVRKAQWEPAELFRDPTTTVGPYRIATPPA